MNLNPFVSQVVLLALAAGILFSYVQPTFTKIGVLQDVIIQYQTERQKVSDVNQRLSNLVTKVNDISTEKQRALLTYMPDAVDQVVVSRDLFTMAKSSGLSVISIDYEGTVKNALIDTIEAKDNPIPHSFVLNVSGTYFQIKSFLSSLEQNNYPLEVHDLSITGSDTGLLSAEVKVITYSHK